jgi:hypothetical protein
MTKMIDWEIWMAQVHPPVQKYASPEYVNNPDNWGPPMPKYKHMLDRLTWDEMVKVYLEVDTKSPSGVSWRRSLVGTVGPAASVKAGSPALTGIVHSGRGYSYYSGTFARRTVSAHRVVFFLTCRYWPEVVDHVDGDSFNNSPDNLRAATQVTNQQNRKMGKVKGFYWNQAARKFYVRVAGAQVSQADDMLSARADYIRAYLSKYNLLPNCMV